MLAAANAAAYAYAQDRRAGLGRDIVREQLTALLQASGVYRAELEYPDVLSVLETNQWANCAAIQLIDAGVAVG
ncbi:hypothetical protein D3C85_1742770 [compost metagenome]